MPPIRFDAGVKTSDGYQLVRLRNGAVAVYSADYDEKMHPGLGPAAEAEALYVEQLNLRERLTATTGEFVVWDVGLGAAANALAVLRATRDCATPLRLISFDNSAAPAAFALANAPTLGYLHGYESHLRTLLAHRTLAITDGAHRVTWQFQLGDFPAWLERGTSALHDQMDYQPHMEQEFHAPHAILYDAFSPAKNPAMWTLPSFTNLFRSLDPERFCALTTYSRSTMLRVTLLLAGFFVGRGRASGLKEETTVAANRLELLNAPLDRAWLERARRSGSAEAMQEAIYRQAPLSSSSWELLVRHPQFTQEKKGWQTEISFRD